MFFKTIDISVTSCYNTSNQLPIKEKIMERNNLIDKFSKTREFQEKGIFSSLFILENQLKTLFNKCDPFITLRQFMLMVMIDEAKKPLTFTQLGALLGCSRQNIKKLASGLELNGFVKIQTSEKDVRAAVLIPTQKFHNYSEEIFTCNSKKLALLFSQYTDQELSLFYELLTKLYQGTELLQ